MSSILQQLPAPKQPKAVTYSKTVDVNVVDVAEPEKAAIGQNREKSDFWQVVPQGPQFASAPHPDETVVQETMESTMRELSRVVDKKLVAANPKAVTAQARPTGPQYIKYTPKQTNRHHNSGVDHRIIQMQEMPVDPLDPPKFRHQKVPRVPDQAVVPAFNVTDEEKDKQLVREERAAWKIPPCVSAYKNAKGYTIPLDKRLAADGRGLQEATINKKHMDLAHALYAAEETARRETELQARVQAEVKQRQKMKKEEQLRQLAQQARMGATGLGSSGQGATPARAAPVAMSARLDAADEVAGSAAAPPPPPPPPPPPGHHQGHHQGAASPEPPVQRSRSDAGAGEQLHPDEVEERRKRDELRVQRRRERERELRLEEKNKAGKRSKLTRDRDRDVSEQIALGQANLQSKEVQYDSRLFNRDQGLASGFKGDDNYNVYDKALFADRSALGMYRSSDVRDGDMYGSGVGDGAAVRTDRFRPDKGFEGTDGVRSARTGPVQFEKEQEADPFGISGFFGNVAKK